MLAHRAACQSTMTYATFLNSLLTRQRLHHANTQPQVLRLLGAQRHAAGRRRPLLCAHPHDLVRVKGARHLLGHVEHRGEAPGRGLCAVCHVCSAPSAGACVARCLPVPLTPPEISFCNNAHFCSITSAALLRRWWRAALPRRWAGSGACGRPASSASSSAPLCSSHGGLPVC